MSASQRTSTEGGQQAMIASQRGEVPRPAKAYFPLGYKASARQWWNSVSPQMAEYNVMSFIPHLRKPPLQTATQSAPVSPQRSMSDLHVGQGVEKETVKTTSIIDPHGPRSWSSTMVQLSGKDRALNEFSVTRDGEEVEENLVMLHGYGAGLGFFYKNYEALSRINGWKIYALDMLGMGRSSRPTFKIHAKDQEGKITEAENWFIDALEEWRILRKIERFTLLGHSMGGYMAVAYALKYPGHLNKLILASPVGIPEDPYAVQAAMPEPNVSTLTNEFAQSQEDIVNANNPSERSSASTPNSNSNGEQHSLQNANKDKNGKAVAPRRQMPKWLTYAWDANISPFSIVRWSGPLGPRFVSGWTSRRFSHLPPQEAEALHDYSVSLFKQKGSGEYALAYILAPGAFARSPLIRRIGGVGRQLIPPSSSTSTSASPIANNLSTSHMSIDPAPEQTQTKEAGIPIILMYGSVDWMDKEGGMAAAAKLNEATEEALKSASKEERMRDNGRAKVLIVKNAGHHVYLDAAEEFNHLMEKEMVETREEGRRLRRGKA